MSRTTDSTSIHLTNGADSVSIAFHGAHVYSYKKNGIERLFLSCKSSLTGPPAIRGGIPLCWPCFGPSPAGSLMKQHGFVRTAKWTHSVEESANDRAVFRLESSPESLAVFPHLFQLVYTVILSPTSLKVVLRVESPTASTLPLPFTTCIHSYLRLPSTTQPTEVTVSPLASLTYVDKVLKGELSVEEKVAVVFDGPQGEIDRVYRHSPNELLIELKNDRNKIKIVKNNLDDVVIWNCGTAHTLGDMEEGGENRFVCVEPTQVSSVVSLNAGESWEGSEEIICLDDALE